MTTRPDGIDCTDWEPDVTDPKGRKCRYYQDKGFCGLEVRLMCTEYLKRNPHLLGPNAALAGSVPGGAVAPSEPARAPQTRPPALGDVLVPPEAPEARQRRLDAERDSRTPDGSLQLRPPPPKPERAVDAARRVAAGEHVVLVADPPPFLPAKEIAAESLEALEARCESISLSLPPGVTQDGQPITLVRKYGAGHPNEISFRDAATLRLLVDAFPGCQIVRVTKRKEDA